MKSTRILKIVSGFLALFVLGGVLGASLQQQRSGGYGWGAWGAGGRGILRQAWIERWADRSFEQLTSRVELRPEQLAALQPAHDAMKAELAELQRETARRAARIIARQRRAIWQQLDESQRQRQLDWLEHFRTDDAPSAEPSPAPAPTP